MSQNIGTLISASIRPNDSEDPIASAWAKEIKGGLHSYQTLIERDSIILQRREWGMLVYVVNTNELYQLKYLNSDNDIMNNLNWKIFTGASTESSTEWLNSVKSVNQNEPLLINRNNGDRYIVGSSAIGSNWLSMRKNVVEWNSINNTWLITIPSEGMTVRADNEKNIIYKFEGVYPSGNWKAEKISQIFDITTTGTANTYSANTNPTFLTLDKDITFITKFNEDNFDASSLNINGLGSKNIRIATKDGNRDLISGDIKINTLYSLNYDGTNFQMIKPFSEGDENTKYYIATASTVTVKPYEHYWIYGDLTLDGSLINYGDIVIANGNFVNNSNDFQQYGRMIFIDITTPFFVDTVNIGFTQSYGTHSGSTFSAYVKDNSLLPTNLNTSLNGGPTAGYILSTDYIGNFKWILSETDISNKVDKEPGKSLISNNDITKISLITVNNPINLDDINDRINELDSAIILKGSWDPTIGYFPSSTNAGWSYIVTNTAIVDGVEFSNGDRLISILDSASTNTYLNNWYKADYTDKVNTVAGKTGNVLLVKADVGLNLVDNTTDISKNVLSATKLKTGRLINGVLFDGTQDITIGGGGGTGAVDSVAGKTGTVLLIKDDVGLNLVDNTTDISKNVLSATKLTTARLIGGVSFDGTQDINLPGVNTSGNQNTSGNAATATKLATGRLINGVLFDGTQNITIGGGGGGTGAVDSVAGKTGTVLLVKADVGLNLVDNTTDISKNVLSATKLTTGRTINGVLFDGSSNISIPALVESVAGKTGIVLLVKADVGLNLVDNTADISKNVLSATKLTTGRLINGVLFDGSSNISISTGAVDSVAGKIGVVTLNKADVGLNLVDNTTDISKNVLSATKLTTARLIGGVSFDGTTNINLPGVNATGNQNTTGNAATATKLATARTINGVLFDGTQNITIGSGGGGSGAVDSVAGKTGTVLLVKADVGLNFVDNIADISKNVLSATKLTTPITINGVLFDGSTSISIPTGSVESVAGRTGDVLLTKADVGLSLVDNTADISKNVLSATKLTTARLIGGVSFNGTANINLPGVNTAGNQNTTGNAATATKLATSVNIGGVSFDGTTNINLPGVNATGNQNTSGNAATATKLKTPKNINSIPFDGTQNIVLNKQIAVGTSTDVQESWNGCTIVFNANCTIRIPMQSAISDSYVFDFWVLPGVTVTWAVNPSSLLSFATGIPIPSYDQYELTTGVIQRLITSNIILHKMG